MSRIMAIGSGKGGVGKTWLAISLAQALARLGRRVLLFDGDFGLANVDVQLGLGPAPGLAAVIAGRCPLVAAIRRIDIAGFDLVQGHSGSGELARIDAARLDRLLADLRALARDYDVTLLDLPAGIDHAVRRLLRAADLRVIVTADEPTALTDAYAVIKVGAQDQAAPRVVVNLADSHHAGQRTHAGLLRICEHFLKLRPPLAGVIRRDPRVADSIRHQVPHLIRHPTSPAAQDVEALARGLVAAP